MDRARDSGSGAREEATGSLDRPIEQDTLDMRRSIEHGEVVAWADATRLWTWGAAWPPFRRSIRGAEHQERMMKMNEPKLFKSDLAVCAIEIEIAVAAYEAGGVEALPALCGWWAVGLG